MPFLGWNIGVTAKYCASINQPVSCDLTQSAPLIPNYNVITKTWWGAFLVTAWSTALVSIALITLETIAWSNWFKIKRPLVREGGEGPQHDWVSRAMHVMENLINAFSEQQTISSLSLIVVAGHDGCHLSTYVFNIVCFFVVMSLITHLNALTNTQNWFADPHHSTKRGVINGFVKVTPIVATIFLAGIMLGSRIGGQFPVTAGLAATLPAVCWENKSSAQKFGFDQVHNKANHKFNWTTNGFIQFLILIVDLGVVGVLFALAIIKKIKQRPHGFRAGLSLVLRWASTLVTTGTLIWLTIEYVNMRQSMEGNPKWYGQQNNGQTYSYFNVVQWALLASSVYSLVNALADAYKVSDITAGNALASHAAADNVVSDADKVGETFSKVDFSSMTTGHSAVPDWQL